MQYLVHSLFQGTGIVSALSILAVAYVLPASTALSLVNLNLRLVGPLAYTPRSEASTGLHCQIIKCSDVI